MEFSMIFMFITTPLLLCSSSALAQQTANPPSLSPTPFPSPAPAPSPLYVNLTDLLTLAGPFHAFLSYLQSTHAIRTFQNQANNTLQGITIFVPTDAAFSSLHTPSLSSLTQDQLRHLILFHALPRFYDLSDFSNLSQTPQTPTFAGGNYTLNFTDVSGTVHISSGWSNTKVSSAVHATHPVAIYQIDKVLLPEAIFGTDIPPAPAPAPGIAPASDSPDAERSGSGKSSSSPSSSPDTSSFFRIAGLGNWGGFVLALFGEAAVVFL